MVWACLGIVVLVYISAIGPFSPNQFSGFFDCCIVGREKVNVLAKNRTQTD